MVQQRLPALVLGRAAEAHRVRFERIPPDEQQIATRDLDAAPQLVPLVAGHRRDDRLRLLERAFEAGSLARANVEHGDLEDHPRLAPASSRREPAIASARPRIVIAKSTPIVSVSVCDSIGPVPFSLSASRCEKKLP